MLSMRFTGMTIFLVATSLLADDKEEIRKLIPDATAMKKEDLTKLATSPSAPKAADIEDKSITLYILSMRADRTDEQVQEFKMLNETPRPSDLAKEISRSRRIGSFELTLGPTTAIHGDRIKDISCEVDGDTARGSVTFHVPNLYEGKLDYIAERQDEAWRITELLMPAHGIHIARGENGLWIDKK